ncbi:MAG: hypothetical protein ACYCQK_01395 [Acidiferrobacteraceae bacterium]
MPINISYQPGAGYVAGMGLLAGQGQWAQNANQILTQQWQTAAQLQNARLLAMQQAAYDQQKQAADQNFQMQMAPVNAGLQMQQAAYQSDLGMQSDAQKQYLQSQYGAAQSEQDFQEQSTLAAQQAQQAAENRAAQIAQEQQGQLANSQAMAQYNADQQLMHQFTTAPFAQAQKNMQQAQSQGMGFSPERMQQIKGLQNDLSTMSQQIGTNYTGSTLMPSIRQKMSQLNQITSQPDAPAPPPTMQQYQQKVIFFNQSTGEFSPTPKPGFVERQIDPKTGRVVGVQFATRESGGGGQQETPMSELDKTKLRQAQVDLNMKRLHYMNESLDRAAKQDQTLWDQNPQSESRRQAIRNQAASEFDAANAGVLEPPPPPAAAAPGVTSPPAIERPSQHPSQLTDEDRLRALNARLDGIPRDKWTKEDAAQYKILYDRVAAARAAGAANGPSAQNPQQAGAQPPAPAVSPQSPARQPQPPVQQPQASAPAKPPVVVTKETKQRLADLQYAKQSGALDQFRQQYPHISEEQLISYFLTPGEIQDRDYPEVADLRKKYEGTGIYEGQDARPAVAKRQALAQAQEDERKKREEQQKQIADAQAGKAKRAAEERHANEDAEMRAAEERQRRQNEEYYRNRLDTQ